MKKIALFSIILYGIILNTNAQLFCFSVPASHAAIAWESNLLYARKVGIYESYLYISNPMNVISAGNYYTGKSKLAYDSISKKVHFQNEFGFVDDSIMVHVDTGIFRAVIPCAGSCNHLATFNRKENVNHNKKLIFTRYYDSAQQISHLFFYGRNALPQMSFYENGATIICEYATDSGKWYGELSKENTVRKTWKINKKDTIVSNLKFGNNLLNPPFYPGYSALPTGTWTFVSSFSPYKKIFYKLSYIPLINGDKIGNNKKEFKLKLTALNGE